MKFSVVCTKSTVTSFVSTVLKVFLSSYSCLCLIGAPPYIDEGPFVPPPPLVIPGDMEVQIGSPGYLIDGFYVTIVCNIINGTRPITIMWFYNGVADPTRGNVSTITVTYYNDGDEYTCRAENDVGFDNESTTINVFGK